MKSIAFTPANFSKIIEKLNHNGVYIMPSDTSYGFCASPFSKPAIQKIQEIKNRSEQKPFLLLAGSFSIARKYGKLEGKVKEFAFDRWQHGPPTTLLLKKTKELAGFFPDFQTVGIRVPYHSLLQKFLCEWGKPLISTSANISGECPIFSVHEVKNVFQKENIIFCDFGDLPRKDQSEIWKVENTKLVRLR
jgi:tRNA threonylcarbamoyl adenosine modification protein (Sua5/YciO/YrdC/YwlC family)